MRLQLRISERRLLLLIGDTAANLLSVAVGLQVWAWVARESFDAGFVAARLHWFALLPPLWLFLARANDFYNLRLVARPGAMFMRLLLITGQFLGVYLFIFFLLANDAALPRLFPFYVAVANVGLVGAWRIAPAFTGLSPRRRALILGSGPTAAMMAQTIAAEAPNDYEIVGTIRSESEPADPGTTLGTGAELPALVDQLHIAELILAYGAQIPGDVFEGIMACYERGISIVPMPILYEQMTGRVPIEHVGQQHWTVVLPLDGQSLSRSVYRALKRLMDIAFSLVGLLVFAIILPPLALIMQLDSPGPVFYRQERVGRGGRLFKVIKLRSMIPDAEKHTGPRWATERDPRITRVGRVLRKTRLDELPQLVNVLRGEMSIVGPRPERPVFVDQLAKQIPFYRTRLVVAPGLTGWAQVRYRYGNSAEDALVKLQYDLYYIRHQSIALDLLIMLRTIGKIFTFSGT